MEKTLLPSRSLKKLLPFVKQAGEEGAASRFDIGDDFDFLEGIGVFSATASGELTDEGVHIFESVFIRRDSKEIETLRQLLLTYPPTIAIQQYLWGVKNISVDQVLVVLKTTGFWHYVSLEPLTHFLDLLNELGIISYHRKTRTLKILISPDAERVPRSVFIDPSRPYSNILWVKRILGECEGYIYWLDKHFQKEALEWLWAIADASKIKGIKILSLDMGDVNLNTDARKSYKRLKQELAGKGIDLTWSTIDSTLIRDAHDRWIIGGNEYVRNVPNVNAISSGQRSEMNTSENHSEAVAAFRTYMTSAKEVEI